MSPSESTQFCPVGKQTAYRTVIEQLPYPLGARHLRKDSGPIYTNNEEVSHKPKLACPFSLCGIKTNTYNV